MLPTADREDSVADCSPAVRGDDGHESEGLGEYPPEIFHLLDLCVVWYLTIERSNLSEEFRPDVRSPGEDPPCVAEEASRCVPAGDEDVKEL